MAEYHFSVVGTLWHYLVSEEEPRINKQPSKEASKQATTYVYLSACLLLACLGEEASHPKVRSCVFDRRLPVPPGSCHHEGQPVIRHLRSLLVDSSSGAAGKVPTTPKRRSPHPRCRTTTPATTTGSPFSFVFFFFAVVFFAVWLQPLASAASAVSSRGWHALSSRTRTRPAFHTVIRTAASASTPPNNDNHKQTEPVDVPALTTKMTTRTTRTTRRATHPSTSFSQATGNKRLKTTSPPPLPTEATIRRTTRSVANVPGVGGPSGWVDGPATVAVAVTPEPLDVPTSSSNSSSSTSSSLAAARSRRTRRVLHNDEDTDNTDNTDIDASHASPATPPKPGRRAGARGASPVSVKPPKGWDDIYQLVTELRADKTAPCDHSGCEALIDAAAPPSVRRFHSLVSLLLSSQTKDAIVGDAIRSMQRDNVLTPQAIAAMTPETLNQYIAKVGFHNNKTKYLKQVCDILIRDYKGDIPPTADAMMQLPGIGPKMAYICESVAWNRSSGIGVDTHMHRLFNALGWVRSKTPEHTRLQLQAWLPIDLWPTVNLLWVGFGQEVQQFQPKILRKALACSRPADALRLLKRCGLDYHKEGKKLGLEEDIRAALQSGRGQDS